VSPYLPALVVAAAALIMLVALVVRAVVLVRRFATLASAYRRQLTAESALLEQRRSGLLAELARHGTRHNGRGWRPWRHA
jgi:hypothetical protein